MNQLINNLRMAFWTAVEHLADDPAALILQLSRRLPSSIVQPLARRLPSAAANNSTSRPVLLALLMCGDEAEVARRLESVCGEPRVTAEHARSLADIALVAHRPELSDAFLRHATGARRWRAAQARRYWFSGEVTEAIEVLAGSNGRSERLQGRRLQAERRILNGWRPALHPVRMEPIPQRVLHLLTNSLPHTSSGYAQRSHSILLAQKEAGWEPLAVTRLGYPIQVGKLTARGGDVVDGITYKRLLPPRLAATMDDRLQQQAEALLGIALAFQPSVLHTTTHYANGIVARAVAEALNIPWVYEVRGQLADTWASTHGPEARTSERYSLFQACEVESMLAADVVLTLGAAMKRNIVAAGVPDEKVLIAPNAVGGRYLAEPLPKLQARRALGLPGEGQYIGTVSSLVPYEGIEDLIGAFDLLASARPDLRLLIVGDGVSTPFLKDQAKRTGASGRIIFTGRVPQELAARYHQALDVFVVPRKDLAVTRSVTPLKPVEALASARPVVASDLPALREIVAEGQTGLFAQPNNQADLAEKLTELLDSDSRMTDYGIRGRSEVLRFRTWASNAERLAAEYDRIIRGKSK